MAEGHRVACPFDAGVVAGDVTEVLCGRRPQGCLPISNVVVAEGHRVACPLVNDGTQAKPARSCWLLNDGTQAKPARSCWLLAHMICCTPRRRLRLLGVRGGRRLRPLRGNASCAGHI